MLSVIPFDDEDQAVELANSTRYGLACGLWTRDFSRTHRLSRSMQADTVWVNTYRSAAQSPIGEVKKSGYGRERGCGRTTFKVAGRAEEAMEEHRRIVEALMAGDAQTAERLATEHMRRARELRIRMLIDQ